MGVNCLIYLPPDVRMDDAASVIGILAGLPFERMPLGGSNDGEWVRVKGVTSKACLAEMSEIILEGACVDGQSSHRTTWHWEPDGISTGERLLYPSASTFWIAIGRRLCDFFGGRMVYNDWGDHKPNYKAKRPRKYNNPSDREPWQKFQEEIAAVKPIAQTELKQADKWAAYKLKD